MKMKIQTFYNNSNKKYCKKVKQKEEEITKKPVKTKKDITFKRLKKVNLIHFHKMLIKIIKI